MSINFPLSSYPQLDVTVNAPQGSGPMIAIDNTLRGSSGGSPHADISASLNNLRSGALQPINRIGDVNRKGFQSDYTAADAAADLWKREYLSFNLNDPDSIASWHETQKERFRDGPTTVNPSETELAAYMEKLRQDGLDGTVDWNDLASELKTFQTLRPDELADSLDYLASRYVSAMDKLERNYSGDALTEQKAKLNDIWQNTVSAMVGDYTSRLQNNLGISDADAGRVKDSFSVILDERIAAYQGALGQAAEALSGPDALWLQNCDAYIAARLREQETGGGTSAAYYTAADLAAAGQIAQHYQTERSNASSGYPNEATLALNLAMADMMGEELISRGLVSDNMAALLRGSRAQGHENVLNVANERLAYRESTRLPGNSEGSFGTVNRSLFQGIYQTVMDKFRESSGDAMEAIRSGAAYGQTATAKAHAQNPKVSRWGISMQQYWKDFTTAPAYGRRSAFQCFTDTWDSFTHSIGRGIDAYA